MFEFERLCSVLVFDNVVEYLKPHPTPNYSLFWADVSVDVRGIYTLYNFERVEVSALFVWTCVDVLMATSVFLVLKAVLYYYKLGNRLRQKDITQVDPVQLYRVSEDPHVQHSQWLTF